MLGEQLVSRQAAWLSGILLLAYAVLVARLSLAPLDDAAGWLDWLPHADKVAHVIVYGVFAGLSIGLLRGRRSVALLWLGIVAYGGLLELAQGLLPARMMSVWDVIANGVGATLGMALTLRIKAGLVALGGGKR